MKTLTITDAKRNLGRWLAAAVKGEEVGITMGATVVALRSVSVEATDYAWREYGATSSDVERLTETFDKEMAALRQEGKAVPVSKEQLEEMLEQATRAEPAAP